MFAVGAICARCLRGGGIKDAANLVEARVERAAHTLKGSAKNMGAVRMSEICAELEEAGRSGELARAPQLLDQLDAEFYRVSKELSKVTTD